MFSKYFIERPVFANVIAFITLLLGAVAFFQLPVSQYPNVVPPTVQVSTTFPGASAKTVMETVGLPIEQQVNGVPGMLYMRSTSSSDGQYKLTVTFEIGSDPDKDAILVQNRLSDITAKLPGAVQNQGVSVRKRSTSILEFITLESDSSQYDSLYLANYARIHLQDELARVPGVGDVNIFGSGTYAMRVWLDPAKLTAANLTPNDVIQAIKAQSQNVASGALGMPPLVGKNGFQYTINVDGSLDKAPDYGNIVVKAANDHGGRLVLVKDLGRVELGSNNYGQVFRLNGKQTAALAIYQLPQANALDVVKAVNTKMKQLSADMPAGIHYSVPFNTTSFVDAAVHEVYKTLIEACFIVLAVILLFLQDWRATLVPATTVPITLVGAFGAMALLSFSLNMSTLFALVLVIGIVIDDAIVIVEGTARHLEEGLSGRQAAIKAMGELSGPIVGITLVLLSVFLPSAFLPGLTGQLYAQFALVIASTALISAINAITLKPTQAALWMRAPKPVEQRFWLYRRFERGFGKLQRGYSRLLALLLKRPITVSCTGLVLVALAFWGLTRVPSGFLPLEDQGFLAVAVTLPDGASLARTDATLKQVNTLAQKVPGVENVVTVAGVSLIDGNASESSAGLAYVVLKPWDERGKSEGLVPTYLALRKQLSALTDGSALVIPPPSITGIGNSGGFTMQVELRDGSFDFTRLNDAAQQLANQANKSGLSGVRMKANFTAPQYDLRVDRHKAATLGVNVDDIFSVLKGYLGSSFVNNFTRFGHTFPVFVQAQSDARLLSAQVGQLKVKSANGKMVPLQALVTLTPKVGPSLITLYNLYPSATLIGQTQHGLSSGQTMAKLSKVADQQLPRGMGHEWTDMSYQQQVAGDQIYYAFALALVLVYFVLAAQYESWFTPLAVVLSVPLALLGTVGVLLAIGIANTLYTQIGLILLVALAAKNAILIVEFARDLRVEEKLSLTEAALKAGQLRLRPILMTSLAFILGMVPLVLAHGAGANASKSIGISVVSGMTISTLLSIFVVPAFFVLFKAMEERWYSRHKG
ncbi:efflux RND transporter permease subunit [Gallaecimonas mangrovi]|uniref:efflux RND transporter permease subunit n=1 Tax=Gallaecimonas mangrovi TaxID=2291597 RepID=UPI000E2095AD|nr:efflux RND transporter permease subunit [Gallaecimonas mangrovi]